MTLVCVGEYTIVLSMSTWKKNEYVYVSGNGSDMVDVQRQSSTVVMIAERSILEKDLNRFLALSNKVIGFDSFYNLAFIFIFYINSTYYEITNLVYLIRLFLSIIRK
jgi:hypothetical protein